MTPVAGSFTFTYSGPSNPPSFAGSYLVTAYFTSSDPNYGNTTATSTMIINPAPATFGNLKSPTIAVGTSSVTLSGTLIDSALGFGQRHGQRDAQRRDPGRPPGCRRYLFNHV